MLRRSARWLLLILGLIGGSILAACTTVATPSVPPRIRGPVALAGTGTTLRETSTTGTEEYSFGVAGLPVVTVPWTGHAHQVFVLTARDESTPAPTSNTLQLVNLRSGTVRSVTSSMLSHPVDFTVDPRGIHGYLVSNTNGADHPGGTSSVSVIDLASGTVLTTRRLPFQAGMFMIETDGHEALLSDATSTRLYPVSLGPALALGTPITVDPTASTSEYPPVTVGSMANTPQGVLVSVTDVEGVTPNLLALLHDGQVVRTFPVQDLSLPSGLVGSPTQSSAYFMTSHYQLYRADTASGQISHPISYAYKDQIVDYTVDEGTGILYAAVSTAGGIPSTSWQAPVSELCSTPPTGTRITGCVKWKIPGPITSLEVVPASGV